MSNRNDRSKFVLHALALAAAAPLFLSSNAGALPNYGINCSNCHDTPQNGMQLVNNQATANLGSGLRKVYQIVAGQTAAIQLSVTDNHGGNYGLNVNGLSAAGVNNSADHLSYTADGTWASRSGGSYFTVGPISTSPKTWTFNLAVKAGTPADYYPLQTVMAGLDVNGTMWSQQESFYVQVVPATAPVPTLLAPTRSGNGFSVQVATTAGFTYYLEFKTSFAASTWTVAAQITGNGTTQTLTDTAATDPERVYRVRVQ